MEATCIEQFPQKIEVTVFTPEEKSAVFAFVRNFTGRAESTHIRSEGPEPPSDEDQHAVVQAIEKRVAEGNRYTKLTVLQDLTSLEGAALATILEALVKSGRIKKRTLGYTIGKRGKKGKE
jgi:hypothetical protein